ncbi:hypothetical protein, conserved [Plasmodium gonderi]|uniref:Uncharacterized protein n=1 Tax=Plasmodium gonderi TaxID=77519 RepID=A0A1Y1JIU7_PLAGO|nr:hypothetical protein, conserved [Plasmodium gonderi]GAW80712.1 hypothetical protein, conserved [Plasmodium gonderi]
MLQLNYYHGEIYEKYKINNVLSVLVDKHKFQNQSIDFNELSNRKNNYSIMALLGSQIKNMNDELYKDIDTNDIILALSKLKQIDEQITINESQNKDYVLELAEQLYYEYLQKGIITNDNSFHLNNKKNFITINLQLMNEINSVIRNNENRIQYLRSYHPGEGVQKDTFSIISVHPEDTDKYSFTMLNEREDYYNMNHHEHSDRSKARLDENRYTSRISQLYPNTNELDPVDEMNANLLKDVNDYNSHRETVLNDCENGQNYVSLKNEKRNTITQVGNPYNHYGKLNKENARSNTNDKKGDALSSNDRHSGNDIENDSNHNIGNRKIDLYHYRKDATNSTYCNSVENENVDLNTDCNEGTSRRNNQNFKIDVLNGEAVDGENNNQGSDNGINDNNGNNRDNGNYRELRQHRQNSHHREDRNDRLSIHERRRSSFSSATRNHQGEKTLFDDPLKGEYLKRRTVHNEKVEEDNSLADNNRRISVLRNAHGLNTRIDKENIHRRNKFYEADNVSRMSMNFYGHRHPRAHASGISKNKSDKNNDFLYKDELNNYVNNRNELKRTMSNITNMDACNSRANIFRKKVFHNDTFTKKGINNINNNYVNNVLENIDKAEQEIVNNHLKNSLTQNEYVARRMSSILLNPAMPQKEIFNNRISYENQSIVKFGNRNTHNNNYSRDVSLSKYSISGQRKNYTTDTNNNSSFIISSSINKHNTSDEDSITHVMTGGGGEHENKNFHMRPRNNYLMENNMKEKNINYNILERNNTSNTPLINMDNMSNFSRNIPKSIESNLNMYTNKYSRALDINDLNSNTSRNHVNSSNSFKSDFTTVRDNYGKMLDRSKSLTSHIYRVPIMQRYI